MQKAPDTAQCSGDIDSGQEMGWSVVAIKYAPDITLEERAAKSDVDAAAMNRAFGLLARWNTTTKGATQGV